MATPSTPKDDDSSKLEEKLAKAEKRVEDLKEKIGTTGRFGEKIRMEVIEKMFDDFDTLFVKYSKDHEVNFMELETCLLMLKKKIDYEQLRTWAPTLFAEPDLNNDMYK